MRAKTEIKENEEITTRYVGPWEGQPRRQHKIEQNWKFICNCIRCHDPTDLGTYFSAIICQKCLDHDIAEKDAIQNNGISGDVCNGFSKQSFGYLLPIDTQILGTPWQCSSCGVTKSVNDIENILETEEKNMNTRKAEILITMNENFSNTVKCVSRSATMLEGKLHPNHCLLFQFKNWVSELRFPTRPIHNCDLDEAVNENDSTIQLTDKIAFLELQMEYHAENLKIMEVLDPGLTLNRAGHHKKMAQRRIQLSKYKMLSGSENYTKLQHKAQMEIAMLEFGEVLKSNLFRSFC